MEDASLREQMMCSFKLWPARAAYMVVRRALEELEKRAGVERELSDPDLRGELRRSVGRNLYFQIEDTELRKRLIGKRREYDQARWGQIEEDRRRTHTELMVAQHRANSLPWGWAGCVAAACVAVGALVFQIYGAIAGALVGFFLGQGLIAKARTETAEKLRAAQEDFDDSDKTERVVREQPEWFTETEQRTGDRNLHFDDYRAAQGPGFI